MVDDAGEQTFADALAASVLGHDHVEDVRVAREVGDDPAAGDRVVAVADADGERRVRQCAFGLVERPVVPPAVLLVERADRLCAVGRAFDYLGHGRTSRESDSVVSEVWFGMAVGRCCREPKGRVTGAGLGLTSKPRVLVSRNDASTAVSEASEEHSELRATSARPLSRRSRRSEPSPRTPCTTVTRHRWLYHPLRPSFRYDRPSRPVRHPASHGHGRPLLAAGWLLSHHTTSRHRPTETHRV